MVCATASASASGGVTQAAIVDVTSIEMSSIARKQSPGFISFTLSKKRPWQDHCLLGLRHEAGNILAMRLNSIVVNDQLGISNRGLDSESFSLSAKLAIGIM